MSRRAVDGEQWEKIGVQGPLPRISSSSVFCVDPVPSVDPSSYLSVFALILKGIKCGCRQALKRDSSVGGWKQCRNSQQFSAKASLRAQ